jgi:hypothetical protein
MAPDCRTEESPSDGPEPTAFNDCEQTFNALERHASAEPIEAASAQGYSSPVLSFYP